jgi:hypothetical protein
MVSQPMPTGEFRDLPTFLPFTESLRTLGVDEF